MNEIDKIPSLNDEQKKKLKKLQRKYAIKGGLIGLKFVSLLFLANIVVLAIDFAYVHSPVFSFIGGAINALFLFRTLRLDLESQRASISEEIKKIVES